MPKTVAEIARETGLSVTTVRLIANGQAGKYRISEATAKIVEEQIRRYGVVVNHAARSLKLRRTDTIGLVVPELSNAFFARLMSGLEELCRGSGLVLLTASTNENPDLEDRAVRSLWARGVDGLIVAPCRTPDYGRLFAKNAKLPIVVVDRAYPGFALSLGRQRQPRGRPRADSGRAGDGRALDRIPVRPTGIAHHRGSHSRFRRRLPRGGHNQLGSADLARGGKQRRRRTDFDGAIAGTRTPAGVVHVLVPDGAGRRDAASEGATRAHSARDGHGHLRRSGIPRLPAQPGLFGAAERRGIGVASVRATQGTAFREDRPSPSRSQCRSS